MDVPEAKQDQDPDLTTLTYAGLRLRVLRRHDGPWFVLDDLCLILTLRSPRSVARRLHPNETSLLVVQGPDGTSRLGCVTETGLFATIMLSRGCNAPDFLRWLVGAAMPLLRDRPTDRTAVHAAVRGAVVEATAGIEEKTGELHDRLSQFLALMETNIVWTNDSLKELRNLAGMILPETRETVASLVARIEGMEEGHVALPATALSYCHVDGTPLAVLFQPDLFEGASDDIARAAGAGKASEDGLPIVVLLSEADAGRRACWDAWAEATPGATVKYGRTGALPMGVGRYRATTP